MGSLNRWGCLLARRVCCAGKVMRLLDVSNVDLSHIIVEHVLIQYIHSAVFYTLRNSGRYVCMIETVEVYTRICCVIGEKAESINNRYNVCTL